MKFSSLTDRVKGSAADAWDLHYLAKQASGRDEDVIVLSVDDPDFATPDAIIDRACAAMRAGDTHYTSILGHDGYRSELSFSGLRSIAQQAPANRLSAAVQRLDENLGIALQVVDLLLACRQVCQVRFHESLLQEPVGGLGGQHEYPRQARPRSLCFQYL